MDRPRPAAGLVAGSVARAHLPYDCHVRSAEALDGQRVPAEPASLPAFVALGNSPGRDARTHALPREGGGRVMMRDSYADRHHHPPLLESAEIAVALVLMSACWFVWYVARERYYLTSRQLAELAIYLVITALAVVGGVILWVTRRSRREKQWPHPPVVIFRRRDDRIVKETWKQNAVVLGYDIHGQPWSWPDRVRVMQAIVLGMTGTGKTTLLRNIIAQDLARVIGPPDEPHRLPMVIFDGKGDLEFFHDLLPHVHRAGRLHQLRLLNPARPDLSVRYNPFQCADDEYMPIVSMIFGSFNLRKEFFAKHQLNYLADIVRVLFYTGLKFNFYDVLVMAMDERVMKEQVEKARKRIASDSSLPTQRRLNFEMSIKNLYTSLKDRERVQKIQGLLNECMTFLDDQLSVLTGPYERLLSLDDVIDQELILLVSLNINKNPEPMRSLGKMLLQNLQLVIGKRYESEEHRRRKNRPMLSIVLDEFAPFGYRNFAQILQTARGTNTAFLFSMQSLPQLMQVGRGFKEEVTSAPNTTITLRTRDEETAEYFIKASAEQVVTRRSVQKERGLFGWGKYEETGRATESENRETRSQDESIKNLPKGQMEILMSDDTRGTLHSLLQVRRPEEVAIPGFQPALYPRMLHSRAESSGANLRFKDPDLARKYRVPSRQVGGFRK